MTRFSFFFFRKWLFHLSKGAQINSQMVQETSYNKARNQEFLKEGEVSCIKETSTNISPATHQKKALRGKTSQIFPVDIIKTGF